MLGPRWLVVGFDPSAARAAGAWSPLPDLALLALVGFVAVAALAAVGALLATAMLVVPAVTARLWTRRIVGFRGGPVVLSDVTLSIGRGQRVGVRGPKGGGKTTLIRALLGELTPRSGVLAVRGRCGTVSQTERSRLDYPVSALDVVLMGALGRGPWWRRPGRAT